MDFTLDKKHEMARQLFRDFAEKEVKTSFTWQLRLMRPKNSPQEVESDC